LRQNRTNRKGRNMKNEKGTERSDKLLLARRLIDDMLRDKRKGEIIVRFDGSGKKENLKIERHDIH